MISPPIVPNVVLTSDRADRDKDKRLKPFMIQSPLVERVDGNEKELGSYERGSFFGTDLLSNRYKKAEFKLVATCLEGRYSQKRRSPALNTLEKSVHTTTQKRTLK